MKTRQKRMGAIIGAVIGIVLMVVGMMSHSNAASYPDEFKLSITSSGGNVPPVVYNIAGSKRNLYCAQPGYTFLWGTTYTYKKEFTKDFTPQMAYAMAKTEDLGRKKNNELGYVEALVWRDGTLSDLSVRDYKKLEHHGKNQTYINILNKVKNKQALTTNEKKIWNEQINNKDADAGRFFRSMKSLVGGSPNDTDATMASKMLEGTNLWFEVKEIYDQKGNYSTARTFNFVKTDPKITADDAKGTYTIGPFKINFSRTTTSNLSAIYLQDEKGTKHNINLTPSNIQPNTNFYVTVNQKEYENIDKVKLVAEYKYSNYNGKYTRYNATAATRQKVLLYELNRDENKIDKKDNGSFIEIPKTIDLGGKAFIDNPAGKGNEPNGYLDDNDSALSGIEVTLFKDGQEYKKVATDTNGNYSFTKIPATGNYYVRFRYNGMTYETTTYNLQSAPVSKRNYATEGKANREAFNKKFSDATGNGTAVDTSAENTSIYAYTGPNGANNIKTYSRNNTEEERKNINLGVIARQKADLSLSKDLVEVNLSINGKTQKYIYNARYDEDMKLSIRGTDVEQYERAVRKTDIEYRNEDASKNLKVSLLYRIRVYNGSEYIKGEITKVFDYYDTDYTYTDSYVGTRDANGNLVRGRNVGWTQTGTKAGNGVTYNAMQTNGYASKKLVSGESEDIYVAFDVKDSAIQDLLNAKEKTKENFAEIGGYKTYYRAESLNGQVLHEEDAPAGLLDIDSIPGNFDPTSKTVQDFIAYSKTDAYKNKTGEEKRAESLKVFEDDADKAPSLKLVLAEGEDSQRKLSGSVWEDAILTDKLTQNLRMGNGTKDDTERHLKGIKVELIDMSNNSVIGEARTDDNGRYSFSGFVPGDYQVRFTYGDKEALQADGAIYNGQDYKSTLYDNASHNPETYWYTADNKKSDATDNMERRQEVNTYSKPLTYDKAMLFKEKADLEKLANNTSMNATTNQMVMEIEYARTQTPYTQSKDLSYGVQNIDFGIAERPHSELTMSKNVSHVKMYTTDGQTIFDSDKAENIPNLAWQEGDFIQATVDTSLQYSITIELMYTLTIENTGERDYDDVTFYQTGVVPSDASKLVTTRASQVVDYVANNLKFENTNGLNPDWEVVSPDALVAGDEQKLVGIAKEELAKMNVIVKAKPTAALVSTELKPAMNNTDAGDKVQSTIFLTKVAVPNNNDTLTYDNFAEIVQVVNGVGRRSYHEGNTSIPGNLNPAEMTEYLKNGDGAAVADVSRYQSLEPDEAKAEQVIILGPFGNPVNTIYYILGGVALVLVLGVGIFLIRKKVLK